MMVFDLIVNLPDKNDLCRIDLFDELIKGDLSPLEESCRSLLVRWALLMLRCLRPRGEGVLALNSRIEEPSLKYEHKRIKQNVSSKIL